MNDSLMDGLLAPYRPQVPLPELVVEVNKIYHALEAESYDQRHPELFLQLPSIWKMMLARLLELIPSELLHVLNYGCGTGFEAEQFLNSFPPNRIGSLFCYDPCIEMLEKCRAKISPHFPRAVFCVNLKEISSHPPRTVLLTNSLLHHLPDPCQSIMALETILSENAIWLAGHEPSNRYYLNIQCMETYNRFNRGRRIRQLFNPWKHIEILERILGFGKSLAMVTAKEACKQGIFEVLPSPRAIGLLVDFHVAHSTSEVTSGRGLDFLRLGAGLAPEWNLDWVKTYSFMGPFFEGSLPRKWREAEHSLAQQYPKDGANFSTIWRRNIAGRPSR